MSVQMGLNKLHLIIRFFHKNKNSSVSISVINKDVF